MDISFVVQFIVGKVTSELIQPVHFVAHCVAKLYVHFPDHEYYYYYNRYFSLIIAFIFCPEIEYHIVKVIIK